MEESLPERLLRLMSDGQWHSAKELSEKIGHRFGSPIHILRKQGYHIETRRLKGQEYEYRLLLDSSMAA